MKTFLTVWIVLLDLIHTADGATNDTTAVKPSRPGSLDKGEMRPVGVR